MTGQAAATRALTRARLRAAAGLPAEMARDLPPRAAAALTVARHVGAPIVPALDAAAASHRHQREIDAVVAAALAPARTVAIALLSLPAVAVPVLGRLLEIDLLAFYTSPAGMAVGAVAVVLWVAGAVGIALLVRSASRDVGRTSPTARIVLAGAIGWVVGGAPAGVVAAVVVRALWRPPPPAAPAMLDQACDLLAAAVQGGLPAGAGLRLVADHVPALADDLRRAALVIDLGMGTPAAATPDALRPLVEVLHEGLATGAPLAPALTTLAHDLRAERGAIARAEAERLPARLTFPTALCLLPATVLAIGAPIVAVGLGTVSGT